MIDDAIYQFVNDLLHAIIYVHTRLFIKQSSEVELVLQIATEPKKIESFNLDQHGNLIV